MFLQYTNRQKRTFCTPALHVTSCFLISDNISYTFFAFIDHIPPDEAQIHIVSLLNSISSFLCSELNKSY